MAAGSLTRLVGLLREAAKPADARHVTDADLLARWAASRDEAAFELLVWRHGRLVLSVCRRLLHTTQDVEDAFQATFLVLVRKAKAITRRQALAAWLHTVAYRTALEARARRRAETAAGLDDVAARETSPDADLGRVLDEEVHRLPEKYRMPFILCYLEGRTNEEAARELGCPLGTVLSRLSRAREKLRARLTQRGLAPAAALVGPALAGHWVTVVPTTLVGSTTTAAAAPAVAGGVASLVEGVIRTMVIAKMKTCAAVVLSVALLGVGGVGGYRAASPAEDGDDGYRVAQKQEDPTTKLKGMAEKLTKELMDAQQRTEDLRRELQGVMKAIEDSKKAPPKTAPRTGLGGGARDRMLQDNADQIRILEARLRAKEAELMASRATTDEAKRRVATTEKGRADGILSQEDAGAAKLALNKALADVQVKEAELVEAKILLDQAMRRRNAPAGTDWANKTAAPNARSLEQRVAELEDRVKKLEMADFSRSFVPKDDGGKWKIENPKRK